VSLAVQNHNVNLPLNTSEDIPP